MELKRVYEVDDEGKPVGLKGVEVRAFGKKQKFSPQSLLEGQAQGWLSMENGVITVRGLNETVRYRVVRMPGYYCCHCGEKLEGDPSIMDGTEGAKKRSAHVMEKHADKKSPDPENPSGYMGTNSFKGVLES
jgi:hypothetical protein